MRRFIVAASIVLTASVVFASDAIFSLSGWAEIPFDPSSPRPDVRPVHHRPGERRDAARRTTASRFPASPGSSRHRRRGRFISLPDNGFGAQGNSADFVIGFYEVTPHFKTDGACALTSRGPVDGARNADALQPIRLDCSHKSYIT